MVKPPVSWSFSEVWNTSLSMREDRPLIPRDYLWASELGKSPVDVWHKLRAIPPSNPPNARSRRKFEAGDVFEWIVGLILKRCGILKSSQQRCEFQYPGLMKVTGKFDFMAGGKADLSKFEEEMVGLDVPEVFIRAGKAVAEYIQREYPNGIEEMPLEIKSVSVFMFERMEAKNTSIKSHRLQDFHYLISNEGRWPQSNLIYICRDDLRIREFPIFLEDKRNEDEYKTTIEGFTKWKDSEVPPPLENEIVFDEDLGKFSRNFNVCYSSYLTLLYGHKNQQDFELKVNPTVSRWNRVMARVKKGDKMTPKNLLVLDEIKASGWTPQEIVKKFPETLIEEEEA